jgi:multiple sugar transport system permease protein
MLKTNRNRRLAADVLTYTVLCILGIFCIGPMLWMFLTSLKPEADIVTSQMQYIPRHVTFCPTSAPMRQSWLN